MHKVINTETSLKIKKPNIIRLFNYVNIKSKGISFIKFS